MSFRILSAGLFLSAALVSSNAYAADLGGDCCADLEERIAELEATTARKGNRKVSLTIYGQVTTAVMFWDGDTNVGGQGSQESNVYVGSPQTSGTRFGFKGGAKITSDWSAGYRIELQWQPSDFDGVQKDNDDVDDLPEFRLSYWELKSKTYGGIQVGRTDTANSSIAEIDLSKTSIADGMSSSQAGDEIIDRFLGGPDMENFEYNRLEVVKYTSPTFAGFVVSAAYGEDDLWDIALRYAGEMGGFKLAAGIAYGETSDTTVTLGDGAYTPTNGNPAAANRQIETPIQTLNGGLSIVHAPTGLFATGSAGQRESDGTVVCAGKNVNSNNGNCDTEWFWFAKGGIEQKWTTLGTTSLFGMGGEYKDAVDKATQYWGLGAVQQIDAAAMELYISYRHYDIDKGYNAGVDSDFDTVVAGGRIKF